MEFIILLKNISFFLVFGTLFFGLSVGLAFLLNFLANVMGDSKTEQQTNISDAHEAIPNPAERRAL